MSIDEQKAATQDGKKDLESHREMKALATRTVPIQAFHDARRTIEGLEKEVCYATLLQGFSILKWQQTDSCSSRKDRL
jgi:hypothetical protein